MRLRVSDSGFIFGSFESQEHVILKVAHKFETLRGPLGVWMLAPIRTIPTVTAGNSQSMPLPLIPLAVPEYELERAASDISLTASNICSGT